MLVNFFAVTKAFKEVSGREIRGFEIANLIKIIAELNYTSDAQIKEFVRYYLDESQDSYFSLEKGEFIGDEMVCYNRHNTAQLARSNELKTELDKKFHVIKSLQSRACDWINGCCAGMKLGISCCDSEQCVHCNNIGCTLTAYDKPVICDSHLCAAARTNMKQLPMTDEEREAYNYINTVLSDDLNKHAATTEWNNARTDSQWKREELKV